MPDTDLATLERNIREVELEELERYRTGTADAPLLYRPVGRSVLTGDQKAAHDDDGLMQFVASDESVDRMGDIIRVKGWQLADFKRNPVFLWAHNSAAPAIGAVRKIGKQDEGLLASVEWAPTPFAEEIKALYQGAFMRAVSVGFRPLDFDPMQDEDGNFSGFEFKKQELLELSAVPVPANARALQRAYGQFAMTVPDLSAFLKRAKEAGQTAPQEPADNSQQSSGDEIRQTGADAALKVGEDIANLKQRVTALETKMESWSVPESNESSAEDEFPTEFADELADLAATIAEKES